MQHFYVWIFAHIVIESFPISSSGHIALLESIYNEWWGQNPLSYLVFNDLVYQNYTKIVFSDFLHGVSAVVIALFFFNRWSILFRNYRTYWRFILRISLLVFFVDVITCFFYVLLNVTRIKKLFPLSVGFIITIGVLFSLRFLSKGTRTNWNWQDAIILGIIQGIALLPGISRFGLTYFIARYRGIVPKNAFEISLLIQWPLIIAASQKGLIELIDTGQIGQLLNITVIWVMLFSGVIAWLSLFFVSYLVSTRQLWWFSVYLIIPLIVLIIT